MIEWIDRATTVVDRKTLIELLQELSTELREHPELWENAEPGAYLDAMAAWLADMDGFYKMNGEVAPTSPSWDLVARMLLAARCYE